MSGRRGERYTDDEIATIRRMASERRTDDEIARALGRSCVGWVGTVRRREGIPSGQMRPYTPEEDVAIREAVATGRTSREIAEELGRTEAAIATRISLMGLGATDRWEAPGRYTPGEIAAIRMMAGERRTDEEIGLLLGRGRVSIARIRSQHAIAAGGGTYDPAPAVDPDLVERIRKLVGQGWSDERIGRAIGWSVPRIRSLRKRLGIAAGHSARGQKIRIAGPQIAAEQRRDAHIQVLRERKAARRAAEMQGVEA